MQGNAPIHSAKRVCDRFAKTAIEVINLAPLFTKPLPCRTHLVSAERIGL